MARQPPKAKVARKPAAQGKRHGSSRQAQPSSTALARRTPEQVVRVSARSRLDEDLAKAFEMARAAQAPSTQDAYESDRAQWTKYAHDREIPLFPITTEHLTAYVMAMNDAGSSVSTIRRRCAALSEWHRRNGQPSPTKNDAFRNVISGLLRKRRSAPTKKRALSGEIVGNALVHPSFSLRDRAILAVGFATGLRRSELVALRWVDIVEHPEGLAVRIAQSKTDKTGRGQYVAIRRHSDAALCPVKILQRWHDEQEEHELVFPVYDKMVAELVKRAVKLAGEDPALYSAHSLRSGMITAAGRDPDVPQVMTQKAARHERGDQTTSYLDVHNAVNNPAFAASVNAIRRPLTTLAPKKKRSS
jgi:integrase